MARYLILAMECPLCGTNIALDSQSTQVCCPGCGNEIPLRDRLCPYCGAYHNKTATSCQKCGLEMTRRCPQCGALNWVGDEECGECGATLDMVALLTGQLTTTDRLDQQMADARQIKDLEETASAARMERMLEKEAVRQAEIRLRIQEQKEQERKALTAAGIIAGIVLIFLLVSVLAGWF